MVMSLYRALNRNEYQFDFIIFTPDHDDYYDEIISLGGRIFHFTKFNGKNLLTIRKEWRSFFSEHTEYTILHSHVRSFASIYIPIANKHGITTIIHSHSTSNGRGITGVAKSLLEFPLRYQADYLFSCSSEAGKWLYGKRAIKSSKYRFVPNAIDVNQFSFSLTDRNRVRTQYGIASEKIIGHVGGFETPKNHTFIIDCFSHFLSIQPNAKLMLVGDGTYENEIKELVKKIGIEESVLFVGLQADVGPYLSAMDIFLFPSLWEGLPVSVVEAQASGLKCLLSDVITHDVELTDLLSYMSLSDGPENWALKLDFLSRVPRTQSSESNLLKLQSFDCTQVVHNLEAFYKSCVK